MKIKCLLVDDEPLALELLETHISLLDQLEVVDTCSNAIKALEILQNQQVDLMFLDIQMPILTGIEFLKSLKNPPKVIFTTAYRDYALQGYELDVVDYLLKPISFDRFFKAINKYFQFTLTTNTSHASTQVIEPQSAKRHFYVKINKKHHKVLFDEVRYIESVKDYIKIHLAENELLVKEKISELESQLPINQFLRIHRSFIVNLNRVSAFTAQDVEIGAIEIPIGVSYKQNVTRILEGI